MDPSSNNTGKSRLTFEGRPDEDYEGFQAAADMIIALKDGDVAQLLELYQMLGRDVMISLSNAKGKTTLTTVAAVWTLLDGLYGTGNAEERAQMDLVQMRQGSTPLPEFIREFDRVTSLAKESKNKGILFREKVVRPMGERLRNSGLTDYLSLRDRALLLQGDVEREYQQQQRLKQTRRGTGNATRGRGAFETDPGDKRKFEGTCYNCDKPGHMARDCRGPKRQRGRGVTPGKEGTKQIEQKGVPLQITMQSENEDQQD